MYIGNVMLTGLNLPLIPYMAKILYIPKGMLISLILIFCLVGVYGVSFSTFDLYTLNDLVSLAILCVYYHFQPHRLYWPLY